MSIGTLWILALALIDDHLGERTRHYVRHPVWISMSLLFLLYLIGGLGTEDTGYWLDKVQVKLPFLAMPFAVAALPGLSKKSISWVLSFFVVITTICSLIVLIRYAIQSDSFTENYIQGMVMPTPLNHIRYSLIVAFSMATAIWLWRNSQNDPEEWPSYFQWTSFRWFLCLSAGFLFVFLHILAVRSGLLASYLVLMYLMVQWTLANKKYPLGIALLGVAVAVAWSAQQHIPTLRNRMSYARYDLEQYLIGEANPGLSDAKRIGSIQAGVELTRENPLIGVGIGNLKIELKKFYQNRYPDLEESVPIPHNQFIMVAACTGLIGLIVFLWSLAAPFLVKNAIRNTLFISLQIIVLSSMLTEATLETQLGLTFYLLFTLLMIRYVMLAPETSEVTKPLNLHQPTSVTPQLWQKDA